MNAKKCKALRSMARSATVGKPERRLVRQSAMNETLVNALSTFRGAYRMLKRQAGR